MLQTNSHFDKYTLHVVMKEDCTHRKKSKLTGKEKLKRDSVYYQSRRDFQVIEHKLFAYFPRHQDGIRFRDYYDHYGGGYFLP